MTHEEYVERFDEYVRLIDQAYEAGDHDEEMMLWKAAEMCLKHGPDAMRGHERLKSREAEGNARAAHDAGAGDHPQHGADQVVVAVT